jgi:kumamolisin
MPNTHVLLKGSRRYHRAGAEILGRADPHEWCEVTVKVRRKTQLPEPNTTTGAAVLTLEQLANQHGADPADIADVERVLGGFGLTVVSKNPETCSVKLAGPAEAMERAFATHLFRATHEGRDYRGRVGDLHIPAELDGKVTGVFGLDTRRMVGRRGSPHIAAAHPHPSPTARPWFLPQELATLYDFPANTGAGQTVALLEFGGQYVASDLATFARMTQMAQPPSVETVDVESLSPADHQDPNATGEVMLDIEVVAGACPGAKQVVYFSNFTEQGWIDALDAAVHDTLCKPTVVSISWGLAEGEDIWTGQAMTAINDTLKAAAALGMPVCIASGDDGSDDQVGDGRAHVNFPAASPYALCVGGTMLPRRGATITEVTWKEGDGLRKDRGGATGGGVSAVLARPAWQNVHVASVNPGAIDGRVVPDVSANAAGSTGYFMVVGGRPQVSGGTSAAAPLWAALIARVNVARAAAAKGKVGYLTPLLYQANSNTTGQPLGAVACKDITQGDNVSSAAGGYHAGIAYDAVTGWGSPQGNKLAQLLP